MEPAGPPGPVPPPPRGHGAAPSDSRHGASAGCGDAAPPPPGRPQQGHLGGWGVAPPPAPWRPAGGPGPPLKDPDRHVRAAAAHVTDVWGRAEASVWVVPGSDEDAARLLGRTAAEMTEVAAV